MLLSVELIWLKNLSMPPDEREPSEEVGSWKNVHFCAFVCYATGPALAGRWVVEKRFISARLFATHSLFQGKINQK